MIEAIEKTEGFEDFDGRMFEGGVYDGEEFSRGEHEIMRSIYGNGNENEDVLRKLLKVVLPYGTEELDVKCGRRPLKYVGIPENEKLVLFRALFPFYPFPGMDEEIVDVHCGRTFRFRDAMIIFEPWNGYNYLVSPYYAESGGMAVDMARVKDMEIDGEDAKHEDD